MTVGDFNTPLTSVDRSSEQKINKETLPLNDTLYQMDLIDKHRTFHPEATGYTLFSSALGTFARIDHMFDTNLNQFISRIFSEHNGMKLEIITRRNLEKNPTKCGD